MCDLFGLSCNNKDRAIRSLPIFSKFSKNNIDGWGIAYYDNKKAIIKKSPEQAALSEDFFKMVEKAKSNIIISHLRHATQGDVCKENCHPFKQIFNNKEWVFAHNGNIYNFPKHKRSIGSTDSENIFNFLLDKIQEYQQEGQIRGIYPGIIKGIKKIIEKFGVDCHLNLLMSDGDILYVFNHYQSRPIYYIKRIKDYGGAFLVSTEKLSNENWINLPPDRLLLLNRGDVIVLSDSIRIA